MIILFFGVHYWDGPWFSKQQFAKRISDRGHKVFYVEESVSIIRRNKSDRNLPFKTTMRKENDNLYIITPSAIFPYPLNYFTRSLYNLKLLNDSKRFFKRLNVSDFHFWFTRPEHGTFLKKINGLKIFDLCDDLPGYSKLAGDEKSYRQQMRFLTRAFKKSDVQIVSAIRIKEKYQSLSSKEVIVIPNGHSINQNSKYDTYIPPELSEIKKPIIGFIGTLFQFTDDTLLEYIVSHRPQYNFVFVGGVEDSFPIEKIKKYSNVYLLGKRPQNEIGSYIRAFDVCLNTFKIHDVNDSVNPVKVFEYVANKRHVISTMMYSLMKEKIADHITFAKNYDEFLVKLDKSLEKDKANNVPDELIKEYHWDNLFESLIKKLKNVHNLEF